MSESGEQVPVVPKKEQYKTPRRYILGAALGVATLIGSVPGGLALSKYAKDEELEAAAEKAHIEIVSPEDTDRLEELQRQINASKDLKHAGAFLALAGGQVMGVGFTLGSLEAAAIDRRKTLELKNTSTSLNPSKFK